MKTPKKKFDAIKMKYKVQKAFQARIAGMTREEELEFYRQLREERKRGASAGKSRR